MYFPLEKVNFYCHVSLLEGRFHGGSSEESADSWRHGRADGGLSSEKGQVGPLDPAFEESGEPTYHIGAPWNYNRGRLAEKSQNGCFGSPLGTYLSWYIFSLYVVKRTLGLPE